MISFTLSFSLSLSLHNYSLISFQILSVIRLLCISKTVAYFNRNSGPLSIPLTPSLITILKYLKDHLLIVIMAVTLSVRLLLINCTSFIEGFRNLYKIILIVMTIGDLSKRVHNGGESNVYHALFSKNRFN